MRVVLLERIERLGQMGDIAEVRNGYARNYLLPQGKALLASPENLERFERDRAEIETRALALRKEAEGVAEKLEGLQIAILRQASDTGSLYGSVTSRDIAEALVEGAVRVTRQQVAIERPIKSLGLHDVRIVLHPEVSAPITVNVARTADEAELQARGLSVEDAEAEHALDAELASEASLERSGAEPDDGADAGAGTDTDEDTDPDGGSDDPGIASGDEVELPEGDESATSAGSA